MTVPAGTPLGTYYLLACADDLAKVIESNETNNCTAAATTIRVTLPDLVESAVSDPPATAQRGSGFSVTDTVLNQGAVAAGASMTRYYLSLDGTWSSGDKRLTGTRSVPALAPSGTSTGTVTVTIPNNTALGTYYLPACADGTTSVKETNEGNNYRASTGVVAMTP